MPLTCGVHGAHSFNWTCCASRASGVNRVQVEIVRAQRVAIEVHDLTGRARYPVPGVLAKAVGVRLDPGPGACSLLDRALYGVTDDLRQQGVAMVTALAGSLSLRRGIRAAPEVLAVLVNELLVPSWIFDLGSLTEVTAMHTWAPQSLIAARWMASRGASAA